MDFTLESMFSARVSPRSCMEVSVPKHVREVRSFVEGHEKFIKTSFFFAVQILRAFREKKYNEMAKQIFSIPYKQIDGIIQIIKDYPNFEKRVEKLEIIMDVQMILVSRIVYYMHTLNIGMLRWAVEDTPEELRVYLGKAILALNHFSNDFGNTSVNHVVAGLK